MQIYQHIKEHTPRGQHLEETAGKVIVEKSVDHSFVYMDMYNIYDQIVSGLPLTNPLLCQLEKNNKTLVASS